MFFASAMSAAILLIAMSAQLDVVPVHGVQIRRGDPPMIEIDGLKGRAFWFSPSYNQAGR